MRHTLVPPQLVGDQAPSWQLKTLDLDIEIYIESYFCASKLDSPMIKALHKWFSWWYISTRFKHSWKKTLKTLLFNYNVITKSKLFLAEQIVKIKETALRWMFTSKWGFNQAHLSPIIIQYPKVGSKMMHRLAKIPSTHWTFNQRWRKAGPAFPTLFQHQTNVAVQLGWANDPLEVSMLRCNPVAVAGGIPRRADGFEGGIHSSYVHSSAGHAQW